MKRLLLFLCLISICQAKEPTKKQIDDSKPLTFTNRTVNKDGATFNITHYTLEKPYLADFFSEGPVALSVEKKRLYLLIDNDVHAFKLPGDKDKILTYDKSFGKEGIDLYKKEGEGWKPKETFSEWGNQIVSRKLGKFGTLLGVPKKENKMNFLQITELQGKEIARFGTDKGDGRIESSRVVRCRRVLVWSLADKGKFLFSLRARDLGMDYPWMISIDVSEKGELFIGFTQSRKGKKHRRSDVTESAVLKLTGLETIKK